MGAALNAFTDFYTHATSESILSSPDKLINDAMFRNYQFSDVFSRSKKAVQGGARIEDRIFFDDPQTAATYKPGDQVTIVNPQNMVSHGVDWRFIHVQISWTEQEVELNKGGGGRDGRFQQFKDLRRFKDQQAITSLMNKIETLMVATASNSEMESAGGGEPYSVFATVTSDGLAPSGFTNVQGINPSTQTKWRNQTASYDKDAPFDVDGGLIAGFDEAWQLVRFKAPTLGMDGEHFTESNMSDCVVLTNKEGERDYWKAVRANNDITRLGPKDPNYIDASYAGVAVKAAEVLDEESSFTSGSPDYLFLNMQVFKWVFYRNKFLDKTRVFQPYDVKNTMLCYMETWGNLFQGSRQRNCYLAGA